MFEMEAKSRVKVGLDQKPDQVSLAKVPGWQSVGGPHLGTTTTKHTNWTQIQVARSVMPQGVASVHPKCSRLGTMCPSERAR